MAFIQFAYQGPSCTDSTNETKSNTYFFATCDQTSCLVPNNYHFSQHRRPWLKWVLLNVYIYFSKANSCMNWPDNRCYWSRKGQRNIFFSHWNILWVIIIDYCSKRQGMIILSWTSRLVERLTIFVYKTN